MKVIFGALVILLTLSGCAANPKEVALALRDDDPKFKSDDCTFIRNKVLDYDDKVGERAVTGLALGLFLGPFGIPIAASMDASQNKERELLAAEMKRRCVTQEASVTPPAPATHYSNANKARNQNSSDIETAAIGR